MISFGGVKSFCQINLPSSKEIRTNESSGKWSKTKKETSFLDQYKIHTTKAFIFAAFQKSLLIHDCKITLSPFVDNFELKLPVKDAIREYHESAITCLSFDETSGLLCTCSDESVFLIRWDVILGKWDEIRISEGEGRIISCCLVCKANTVYVSVFKSDSVVTYKIISAHPLTEPGPLILNSIDCIATLEKVKEPTTHCQSFFIDDDILHIASISSGNAVSAMLWELQLVSKTLRLVHHQSVRNTKSVAACDIVERNGEKFMLVVSPEGFVEVYLLQSIGFLVLARMKVEDSSEEFVNSTIAINTTVGPHTDFRILCAKFLFVSRAPTPDSQIVSEYTSMVSDENNLSDLSAGDATSSSIVSELDNTFTCLSPENRRITPKLMIVVATSAHLKIMDVKSGEPELSIGYEDLLKEEGILVQNVKLAVDTSNNEIIVALQPCLTSIIFCRRCLVTVSDEFEEASVCSLIPTEGLNSKSVLRKKLKSPPRSEASRSNSLQKITGPRSKYLPAKPAWARSRSRPAISGGTNLKTASKSTSNPLLSARSRNTMISQPEFLVSDGLPSSRPVRIQVKGSYDEDELKFKDPQRINLQTRMSEGLSYMRLAANRDGKLLAVGASVSPMIIMKTQPFENIRLLKDVARVTSLSFSFNSDLLIVASNNGKTSVLHWQNTKELLNFDFNSKFNEHIHSQFYFMDKFILQPEANRIALYSYAKRDTGFIKLQAGSFPLQCQSITAVAAANQFYSNQIITGLSNKSIQTFDTNVEKVGLTIVQAHNKPVSCIRINEAPKGTHATDLCDFFMTSSPCSFDPIKLWDLRSSKCVLRISDVNPALFVSTTRPSLSPCGRYIASGFEDNLLTLYDIRKINSRVLTFKEMKSSVLDCCFDLNFPMIWCGCKNGSFWNFYTQ